MSQLALLPEDLITNEKIFPAGKYDKDGQQLDLRDNNSWMYELEDVSLVEMYEILQINLIAPFLLNTKLLPVLQQNKNMAFIINVSAMEGNFYAPRKHSRHPHNEYRRKHALNMMTRTVAEHYKNLGVFMNSVDTGWITNEKPNPQNLGENERKSKMAIDETDGAMRVLDQLFQPYKIKNLSMENYLRITENINGKFGDNLFCRNMNVFVVFISKPFEDLIFWFVNRELSITNTNGALFWGPFCYA